MRENNVFRTDGEYGLYGDKYEQFISDGFLKGQPSIINGGSRRTAQIMKCPDARDIPFLYTPLETSYDKILKFMENQKMISLGVREKITDFDYSAFEVREIAFSPMQERTEFYSVNGSFYKNRKRICLTRNQLIKESERHHYFKRYTCSVTGRFGYSKMLSDLHYDDCTVKTDTAVYALPYKYSVPGFYEETDNTSSALFPYNVYESLRLQVRINEPIYFGEKFDFKEYEREKVFANKFPTL